MTHARACDTHARSDTHAKATITHTQSRIRARLGNLIKTFVFCLRLLKKGDYDNILQ